MTFMPGTGGVAWKGVREGAYRAMGAALITGGALGVFVTFVARHSETLTAYVLQTFKNPTLVEIINWIARIGS